MAARSWHLHPLRSARNYLEQCRHFADLRSTARGEQRYRAVNCRAPSDGQADRGFELREHAWRAGVVRAQSFRGAPGAAGQCGREEADRDATGERSHDRVRAGRHRYRLPGGFRAPQRKSRLDCFMADVTIEIIEHGPYIVTGPAELKDGDGNVYPGKQRMALCRCGASTTKPFCDGTHSKIGFQAAERAVPGSAEG